MTSLISNLRNGERVAHRITLDDLWAQAERMGTVEVDRRGWSKDYPYVVEITFHRASGTRVHAKGTAMGIHEAMMNAIQEARDMGA